MWVLWASRGMCREVFREEWTLGASREMFQEMASRVVWALLASQEVWTLGVSREVCWEAWASQEV